MTVNVAKLISTGLGIICFVSIVTEALQCYECSSYEDGYCHSWNRDDLEKFKTNCAPGQNACKTIELDGYFYNDHFRFCAAECKVSETGAQVDIDTEMTPDGVMKACCTTDNCNAATTPVTHAKYANLILTLAAFVTLAILVL